MLETVSPKFDFYDKEVVRGEIEGKGKWFRCRPERTDGDKVQGTRVQGTGRIFHDGENNATLILGDNNGVVINTSNVESSLNMKHSSIAYRFARRDVPAGVCKVAWVKTGENIADATTKRLSVTARDYLFGQWTY